MKKKIRILTKHIHKYIIMGKNVKQNRLYVDILDGIIFTKENGGVKNVGGRN